MIEIIHGDDIAKSRQFLSSILDKLPPNSIQKLEGKEIDHDKLVNYLNTNDIFSTTKNIILYNFFSLHPSTQKKIAAYLINKDGFDLYIWQDKTLTTAQLSQFPKAKKTAFPLPKLMFVCLNAIRPGNYIKFQPLYQKLLVNEPFELFLYLFKGNLRRLLIKSHPFDPTKVIKAYFDTIIFEYQLKSGLLNLPKELKLDLIIKELIK